jgi:formate/nitrite transporter
MDHVTPNEIVANAVELAVKKAELSAGDLMVRGIVAGALLGIATSFAFIASAQGLPALVGALIFPVGFVILVLLGQELATGNFAFLPMGVLAGRVGIPQMLRNWVLVYAGNLIGSVLYGVLFYLSVTSWGKSDGGVLAELVRQAAQKKTIGFAVLGVSGWGTAFVRAMLCNWMVTLGAVLSLASRSTTGKVLAMWLPITTFFALGFEHSIVNMFVIPTGMLLNAPVPLSKWWVWNQIPVTLGNITSGILFTAIPLFFTYYKKPLIGTVERRLAAEPEIAAAS